TLEALAARRGPRQGVALPVGDRDDRVVEGRVHVADAVGHILADLLAHTLRGGIGGSFCHEVSLSALFLEGLSGLARTLAGTGIGACALPAHRQAAAMAKAPVATDVHQALDVHGRFAAQVALDGELPDLVADLFQIAVGQVLHLLRICNAGGFADLASAAAANAEDRRQADFGVLMRRNIDASDTCHVRPLKLFANQPWRCLWRGSVQITRTMPLRRMILQLRQIFLTEAETLITILLSSLCAYFARNTMRARDKS